MRKKNVKWTPRVSSARALEYEAMTIYISEWPAMRPFLPTSLLVSGRVGTRRAYHWKRRECRCTQNHSGVPTNVTIYTLSTLELH